MKLPMVEAMTIVKTGEVKALTPRLAVSFEVFDMTADAMRRDRAYQVRAKSIFTVDQWADDSRELHHLRRQAERVLMSEVYGPVEARLFEILKSLWEAGPAYDDKIAAAIEELIRDLRP